MSRLICALLMASATAFVVTPGSRVPPVAPRKSVALDTFLVSGLGDPETFLVPTESELAWMAWPSVAA